MITELLDLKKDRVRDELVQLTRAQTDLVRTVLVQARMDILQQLLDMVHTLPLSGTPEEMRSAFRVRLESGFSQIYAEASARALEGDQSKVVRIDPNQVGHSAERVVDCYDHTERTYRAVGHHCRDEAEGVPPSAAWYVRSFASGGKS